MWTWINDKLKGWRTIVASAATTLVGVATLVGAIDITPLVRLFVHDENAVAAVLVLLGLGFGLLRLITTGPVGEKDE